MSLLYVFCLLILLNSKLAIAQWPQIQLNLLVAGIDRPVLATHAGDSSGRLFIVEQSGKIRIFSNDILLATPFLDITNRVQCCSERGLLSVAFPPGYGASKSHFYVNYTNTSGNTIISRFALLNTNQANPDSEEIVLEIVQPFSNHNGGQLAFGPDGMLYIGMGDGGSDGINGSDGSGLVPDTLLGKMLRIDVESGVVPYAVPVDNPFVNLPGVRPEIWSYGLRNPWRFSFDRATGDLYIADVGEDSFEEINVQDGSSPGGENYGWNILEGVHCLSGSNCNRSGITLPKLEYSHSDGNCSISGGYVYRGANFPGLQGIYLFGDFCSGRMGGLRRTDAGWESALLLESPHSITSFGEDESGNIYLASFAGGLYQIIETVEIAFNGFEQAYSPGQSILISLNELSSSRVEAVDLWIAVQAPNNDIFFLSPEPGLTPLPFKTNVPVNETSQSISVPIPIGAGVGTYTFFAVYSEQGAVIDRLGAKLRSNILSQSVQVF